MRWVSRVVRFLGRPEVRNRVVYALWLMVAVAVAVRLSVMLAKPILPGEYIPGSDRYFVDYRETIWTPGRFLLGGGNPYDPDSYLAANPWALPFMLYVPAWLLLAAALAPLPYLVSIIVFQALSLAVAIVMLRVIFRWALPTLAGVAVPAALLWMNIWYAGRAALSVQLGTLLAVLGTALVLRSLAARTGPESDSDGFRPAAVDRLCATGVALTMVKAQFGLVALVALAGGRWRRVWRGIAGLVLVSMPVLIVCTIAAGGPVDFVRSVLRNLEVANSAASLSSLSSPNQRRLDVVGLLARYGLDHPPSWIAVAVPVLALVAALAVVRLTRNPLLVSAVVCPSVLLGIYHGTYDLLLLLIPVAVGLGMALRREISTAAEWAALGALLLVVLHLQTVSTSLVPGLDMLGADTVNVVLIMVGLLAGMYGAISSRWGGDNRQRGTAHSDVDGVLSCPDPASRAAATPRLSR